MFSPRRSATRRPNQRDRPGACAVAQPALPAGLRRAEPHVNGGMRATKLEIAKTEHGAAHASAAITAQSMAARRLPCLARSNQDLNCFETFQAARGEPEQNPKGAADRSCAAPEATTQPWVGSSWRSVSAGAPACFPGRAAARPCKLHRLYTPPAATIASKVLFVARTTRHLAMQTPGRPVGGAGRRWRLRFGRPTQACAPLAAHHLPAVCGGR